MVNNNKITMEEGQLITFHITRLEAPRPSWVALTGEEEPGGMEALRTFVEEGRKKTLRGCSGKVKARCLQMICLFFSRIWFLTKCDQGNTQ